MLVTPIASSFRAGRSVQRLNCSAWRQSAGLDWCCQLHAGRVPRAVLVWLRCGRSSYWSAIPCRSGVSFTFYFGGVESAIDPRAQHGRSERVHRSCPASELRTLRLAHSSSNSVKQSQASAPHGLQPNRCVVDFSSAGPHDGPDESRKPPTSAARQCFARESIALDELRATRPQGSLLQSGVSRLSPETGPCFDECRARSPSGCKSPATGPGLPGELSLPARNRSVRAVGQRAQRLKLMGRVPGLAKDRRGSNQHPHVIEIAIVPFENPLVARAVLGTHQAVRPPNALR